jgi:hypothetical protein
VLTEIAELDDVLNAHAEAMGGDAFAQWPSAGFHKAALSLNRLASHPLSPLPMVRL